MPEPLALWWRVFGNNEPGASSGVYHQNLLGRDVERAPGGIIAQIRRRRAFTLIEVKYPSYTADLRMTRSEIRNDVLCINLSEPPSMKEVLSYSARRAVCLYANWMWYCRPPLRLPGSVTIGFYHCSNTSGSTPTRVRISLSPPPSQVYRGEPHTRRLNEGARLA